MSKSSLREQLYEATTKAENEIKETLQRFHDETGMIPKAVTFDSLDTSDCSLGGESKSILVCCVVLKANT